MSRPLRRRIPEATSTIDIPGTPIAPIGGNSARVADVLLFEES
jgi:hypothetical protein